MREDEWENDLPQKHLLLCMPTTCTLPVDPVTGVALYWIHKLLQSAVMQQTTPIDSIGSIQLFFLPEF